MGVMDTQTIERTETDERVDDGTDDDTPKVFHYVKKDKIVQSAVEGTHVVALCGEVFPAIKEYGATLGLNDPWEANAPVHFPRIWTTSWFEWVQYNGAIKQPMTRNAGEAMPVLAAMESRSKIAMPVTSLPVPDVVGQAMCGLSGPGTGAPAPTGALT